MGGLSDAETNWEKKSLREDANDPDTLPVWRQQCGIIATLCVLLIPVCGGIGPQVISPHLRPCGATSSMGASLSGQRRELSEPPSTCSWALFLLDTLSANICVPQDLCRCFSAGSAPYNSG